MTRHSNKFEETPEPQQVNRHETLVNRLRMPLTERSTEIQIQDKWNAIGEALAYLIDKKHSKLRRQKLKKKVKVFRKSRKS